MHSSRTKAKEAARYADRVDALLKRREAVHRSLEFA